MADVYGNGGCSFHDECVCNTAENTISKTPISPQILKENHHNKSKITEPKARLNILTTRGHYLEG